MKNTSTKNRLQELHDQYRKLYRESTNPKQMCCMWSIKDPPNDLVNTDQIYSIEEIFNIALSEEDVMDIYDMNVVDAAARIDVLLQEQCE